MVREQLLWIPLRVVVEIVTGRDVVPARHVDPTAGESIGRRRPRRPENERGRHQREHERSGHDHALRRAGGPLAHGVIAVGTSAVLLAFVTSEMASVESALTWKIPAPPAGWMPATVTVKIAEAPGARPTPSGSPAALLQPSRVPNGTYVTPGGATGAAITPTPVNVRSIDHAVSGTGSVPTFVTVAM